MLSLIDSSKSIHVLLNLIVYLRKFPSHAFYNATLTKKVFDVFLLFPSKSGVYLCVSSKIPGVCSSATNSS